MPKENFEPGIRDPRRTRWIAIGVFVLVLVVSAVSAGPVWRAIKEFRAHQLTEEARVFLEKRQSGASLGKGPGRLSAFPFGCRGCEDGCDSLWTH